MRGERERGGEGQRNFEDGKVDGLVDLRPADQCLESYLFPDLKGQAWIGGWKVLV